MPHRVEEVNRIEDLAALGEAWQGLWTRTPRASFFQSLAWLEAYWRRFGQGQKLRCLVVCSGDEPEGIMPLVVRTESTRVGPLRVLTFPLHDWGSFYGPIGQNPAATLNAGLQHVRRTTRDWDLIELRWIDSADADSGQTERAMREAGFPPYKSLWNWTAMIDLAGGWERYFAGRPHKWRGNLRRAERRLAEQGRVQFVRYRPRGSRHDEDDPRWDLYDACETIARHSWQGNSATGTTLSHESIRSFLREAHEAAARLGCADLNLLTLDGRPAAFAYNYHWHGQVYGLRAGFDAQVSRGGAGNVLLAEAIRDSFARGDATYDLGTRYLQTKRHLMTGLVPIFRYSYFHPGSPRALVVRAKRWLQQRALQRQLHARGVLAGTEGECPQ